MANFFRNISGYMRVRIRIFLVVEKHIIFKVEEHEVRIDTTGKDYRACEMACPSSYYSAIIFWRGSMLRIA